VTQEELDALIGEEVDLNELKEEVDLKADDKRVSSAQHIVGDTHNDIASDDDIEALLAQFGK